MQGRAISRSSRTCTVFSSNSRDAAEPGEHDVLRHLTVRPGGRADRRRGATTEELEREVDVVGSGLPEPAVGRSKMRLRVSHSWAMRPSEQSASERGERWCRGHRVASQCQWASDLERSMSTQGFGARHGARRRETGLLGRLGADLVGVDPGGDTVAQHGLAVDLDVERADAGGEREVPRFDRLVGPAHPVVGEPRGTAPSRSLSQRPGGVGRWRDVVLAQRT